MCWFVKDGRTVEGDGAAGGVAEHPGQNREPELRAPEPYQATQEPDGGTVEQRGEGRASDLGLGRHQRILRYSSEGRKVPFREQIAAFNPTLTQREHVPCRLPA
jgi:hypothetical protein